MMKNFFVGIKAVILRDDKILLVKGVGDSDFWDVPGGRIDDDETTEQTLLRELSEELPSHKNPIIGNLVHAYRVPGSIKDNLGLVLLFYVVSVDLESVIELSDEHTEYAWASMDFALEHGSDAVKSLVRSMA